MDTPQTGDLVCYNLIWLSSAAYRTPRGAPLWGRVLSVSSHTGGCGVVDTWATVAWCDGSTGPAHIGHLLSYATRCLCGQTYHHDSGHILSPDAVLCGPCARHFTRWLSGHTKRRWGGANFYDHAATSVRPQKPQ